MFNVHMFFQVFNVQMFFLENRAFEESKKVQKLTRETYQGFLLRNPMFFAEIIQGNNPMFRTSWPCETLEFGAPANGS